MQQLLQKPQGGEQWLLGLRGVPYSEAVGELCSLCGVGPKVGSILCTTVDSQGYYVPAVGELCSLCGVGPKVGSTLCTLAEV